MSKSPRDIIEASFRKNPELMGKDIAELAGCSDRTARRIIARLRREAKIKRAEHTIAILPDIHCPYHDVEALEIAVNFCASKNPDEVILAGDAVDFYRISRFKSDPQRMPFKDEIYLGREMLQYIRKSFPKARLIYLEGNHEQRLKYHTWTNSKDFAGLDDTKITSLLRIHKNGFKYLSNTDLLEAGKSVFSRGKLFIIHGHEVKVGHSVVNPARIYYQRTHVNVLVGHVHKTSQDLHRRLDGKHDGSWTMGCLQVLGVEFAPINNWNHGFAIVRLDGNGYFEVNNKTIINGKVF